MLEIVSGNIEMIKSELKQAKQWKVNDEKELKKQIKKWKAVEKKAAKEEKRGEKTPPKEFDQMLVELGKLQSVYSTYIPVQVENLIIDYKTYQAAVKKLKDFEITIAVKDQKLILSYRTKNTKGSVHLYDLSTYFRDFHHVPLARMQADG